MLATAPADQAVVAVKRALQMHCPDNIRIDHITVVREVDFVTRRIVVTVTRDGNPQPITFWVKTKIDPNEFWFPYRETLARIGLLA